MFAFASQHTDGAALRVAECNDLSRLRPLSRPGSRLGISHRGPAPDDFDWAPPRFRKAHDLHIRSFFLDELLDLFESRARLGLGCIGMRLNEGDPTQE